MNLLDRIDPTQCAIVVIDVQNDFCSPEGALAKRGNHIQLDPVISMIPRLNAFIEKARTLNIPVVFIRTEHDETTDSAVWRERYGTRQPAYTCRTGTWGTEFYEVTPQSGDVVITKNRYSAFVGTNLDVVLKSLGRSSLLFTGVATNTCVESSLRDALMRYDYHVTLVEDCCATYQEVDHQSTIRNVQSQFGIVTTSEEISTGWQTCK